MIQKIKFNLSNFIQIAVAFSLGALISFISTRYTFFNFENKITYGELMLTFVNGSLTVYLLYLTNSLQKKNSYNHLLVNASLLKLENYFKLQTKIFSKIENNTNLRLTELNIFRKQVYSDLEYLSNLLNPIVEDKKYIIEFRETVERFVDLIEKESKIKDNICDYSSIKSKIKYFRDNIEKKFSLLVASISKLVA